MWTMVPIRVIRSLSKLIRTMGLRPMQMWPLSHTRVCPNVGLDVVTSSIEEGKIHPANEEP